VSSSRAFSLRAAEEPERPSGGSVREVATLAAPAVLHSLSDTAMQVVDAAIVGHLGVTELGAVGFASIWVWTLTCGFVGAASGVQTFVAQELGAGRDRECRGWTWQGLYAVLPPAVLAAIAAAFVLDPFFAVLGPSPELRERAVAYAGARLWGMPGTVTAMVLASFFRGLGDTRTPLVAAVVANLLNVTLAYGLVFGAFGLPVWGVAGAGAAMAIASWTGAAVLAVAFRWRSVAAAYATGRVAAHVPAIRRFLRTSAPIGGQWVLDMASFALFTSLIAHMGDRSVAASQALIQLLSLSFMQAVGISIAAGALVGRYVGARDFAAAERSHRSALALGAGLALVVGTLLWTIPDVLLGIFTSDAELVALGRPLLALGAVFQLVDALGIVCNGSLRGAGDTRWPLLVQATLAWALRLPLVYLAAVVLQGGVLGAWIGELGFISVLCAAFLARFHGGAWRRVRI